MGFWLCSSHSHIPAGNIGGEGGIWLWKLSTTPHPFQVIFKPFGHARNPPGVLQAEVWGGAGFALGGERGQRCSFMGYQAPGTSNILHN